MTTIELKKILLHRIVEIIVLTPEQRNEIIESKKEIEQGLFVGHDILDKEVSTWLNSR
jgi:hypothetical protein